VDESQQWVAFGKWLAEQREHKGLRRREAARRAKVSEAVWRDLETGRKQAIGGIRLLPNPSQAVLERVATALDVPLEEVLAKAGRSTNGSRPARSGPDTSPRPDLDSSTLGLKLRRLGDRDRIVVERLVDAMLEHDED
jgi:transcriptional regulator with XRE-family HTH domain